MALTELRQIVFLLAALLATSYECPSYESIRQPSVGAEVFNISDFSGVWYLVATNEPTIPPFCTCGVNTVDVHPKEGWYAYSNVDTCGKANISVPIKGVLSSDADSPGFLMENFGPSNHTARHLDPNMIFQAEYDKSGSLGDAVSSSSSSSMQLALTYACISDRLYSFNVLSRTTQWSIGDLESIVALANASTAGLLRVEGMRFADEAAYAACGMA